MSKIHRAPRTAGQFRRGSPLSADYDVPVALPEEEVPAQGPRGASTRAVPPAISDPALRKTAPANDASEDGAESQPRLRLASLGEDHFSKGNAPAPAHPDFPLVADHSNAVAAESFGILRSRLLSAHNRLGIRSVVITSAETGDGKTLVAANLGLSLGQLGAKRILLVDGDLRIATVTRIFNLKQAVGIGDFLQGNAPFEAVVRKTQIPALSVAPSGTVSKKVLPELLQGPHWSEFLERAKQEFDLIIVDTIPISAPVVDLELLTEPCDAVLLVVRMRQTNRQALKRVASRLDVKKFLGVIVNNADEIYDYDYGYVDGKK